LSYRPDQLPVVFTFFRAYPRKAGRAISAIFFAIPVRLPEKKDFRSVPYAGFKASGYSVAAICLPEFG